VYGGLLLYRPHDDGLVIVPYGERRMERNLRDANGVRPVPTPPARPWIRTRRTEGAGILLRVLMR